MILGGEQPVALPTMSWYDKDAFKMYIAAVKDDYDKNIEEQKDFLDKYIDMAATDKDREYIANNVINPVVNFVNNNPNAIRSVEGRMMMRQLRNAINPEAIGRIKGTAKIADPYNKVKAELQAKGLYSKDFEDYNGGSLESWDSVKNGVFTKAAPTQLQNLTELSNDFYKDLQPTFKEKVGQFGRRMAITEQDLKDVLTDNVLKQITQSPMGQYYKHIYKDNEDKLKNAIVQSQRSRLRDDVEIDKVAEAEYDAKVKAAELKIKQQQAALDAQESELKISKLLSELTDGYDTYSSHIDFLDRSGDLLMEGGYDQFEHNVQKQIRAIYNKMVKNDTKLKGFKKGSKEYNDRLNTIWKSAYKQTETVRTNEWIKNVKGRSIDQLSVTIGTDLLLNKLRQLGTADKNGYYAINPKYVKILNNNDMTKLKNGRGYTTRNYGKVVMYKPAQDSKALNIIGKDGNPYMWIKMVNREGQTRWINAEGYFDPNRGVAPEQDQRVLQKLGLKKQEGTVNNR